MSEVPTRYRVIDSNELFVRSMFLLSCRTGMRISDILSIQRNHIVRTDHGYRIKKNSQKTNTEFTVPLSLIDFQMIESYQFNLSRVSQQKMNVILRRILRRIYYFNRDSIYSKEGGGFFKIYEIISFHTGRRSFITNIVMRKDTVTSMSYTDHKKVTTAEGYITKTDQDEREFFSWFDLSEVN